MMKENFVEVRCVDCGRRMNVWKWDKPEKENVCPDCTLSRKLRDDENYPEEDYTFGERVVFCPWCGEWYEPDVELIDGEQVCDECGKRFTVESEVEVTFSTQRVEEEEA